MGSFWCTGLQKSARVDARQLRPDGRVDPVMSPSSKTDQPIEWRILLVRGQRVMLDTDLASLYGVEVKALNQAVRRNADRFPSDFMLQLSWDEAERSRSQFVTLNKTTGSNRIRGHNVKYRPLAFTEQGVAMLSSVLRSRQAVRANVEIMRAFVRLRGMVVHNAELARRLDDLESKYDRQFKVVFDAIRELMTPPDAPPKRRIGFVSEESRAGYQSIELN
jgi:ORF6N domain-containing protein